MDIEFKEVEHRYMPGTPFEKIALKNISLRIPSGSFTAIIGHTGSGKSTFLQHLNGLLKPTSGEVQIGSFLLKSSGRNINLKELRRKVGLVFQYPEHQLFEETVAKDICFGPINFGLSQERALNRAKKILPHVGLSEELLLSSPFLLSGGQMRRVAIAGVLAVEPEVLVLDEPTAGLDPSGRKKIMELFLNYHRTHQTTTILVTHHMEDAARYADNIIVLNDGRIELAGNREKIFSQAERLTKMGLDLPDTIRLLQQIKDRFQLEKVPMLFEIDELAQYLSLLLQRKGSGS